MRPVQRDESDMPQRSEPADVDAGSQALAYADGSAGWNGFAASAWSSPSARMESMRSAFSNDFCWTRY